MTRISNADHVLLLLQEQLGRLGKERSTRQSPASPVRSATADPMVRLRALAGRDGISEEDLKRALVRGLLVEQLGEAIGTDPEFEAIAGEVTRILGESAAGRDLIDQALRQLNAS